MLIGDQLQVIDIYADAVESRPADPDVVTQLGLWEATPDVDLEAAASAFAAGDLEASAAAADAARLTWLGAPEIGRTRALIIAAVVLAVLFVLIVSILGLVRRSRHRRATRAGGGSADVAVAVDPDRTEVGPRPEVSPTAGPAPAPEPMSDQLPRPPSDRPA